MKKTDEEDVDRSNLEQAIAVISRQSKEANEGIALTKSRLYCSDYAQDLVKKPGDLFVSQPTSCLSFSSPFSCFRWVVS